MRGGPIDARRSAQRLDPINASPARIALPDELKDYVKKRIGAGGYSSVSEYVRELIPA
jgi:hypothetical protein